MATHSIITQVIKDEDVYLGNTNNNNTINATITTTAATNNTNTINSNDVPKKPKAPSLFRQLLCCFRPRTSVVHQRNIILGQHSSSQQQQQQHSNNCNNNGSSVLQCSLLSNTIDEMIIEKVHEDKPLLDPPNELDSKRICVVIDLDETLVHSSFAPVQNADFIIPVDIEGTIHQVYVLKRPYVDEFLKRMGELFECILFTASLGKYADPVTDLLDKWNTFRVRLFRESCVFYRGSYVKDLSRLGRDMNRVVILDNSPASYMFHPQHAVPILSWFDDPADRKLLDLIPFFEELSRSEDAFKFLVNADLHGDMFVSNYKAMSADNDDSLNVITSPITTAVTNSMVPPVT